MNGNVQRLQQRGVDDDVVRGVAGAIGRRGFLQRLAGAAALAALPGGLAACAGRAPERRGPPSLPLSVANHRGSAARAEHDVTSYRAAALEASAESVARRSSYR